MENNHILVEIYKKVVDSNIELRDLWLTHIFLTWRWWFEVGLAIIPWIVWLKIRSRKDSNRLLIVGLIVAMITNVLDNIGICYGLWYYDYKLFPITPTYMPWDYSLFPVSIMFLLQFKPKINPIYKSVGFALMSAFVFEPFFTWLHIYEFSKWKHWYSFVVYVLLYLIFNKIYNSSFLTADHNK